MHYIVQGVRQWEWIKNQLRSQIGKQLKVKETSYADLCVEILKKDGE